MYAIRAIYQRQRDFDDSIMVIQTAALPTAATNLEGAQGYVSEEGERWPFSLRTEGDRLLMVWGQKAGRPFYGPATLSFGVPIQVGGFVDRHDHGADEPYEYLIDYIGPELK